MIINQPILLGNAFISAFSQSDYFGKIIFIALFILSIFSWVIIIYKTWFLFSAKKSSLQFYNLFQRQPHDLLNIVIDPPPQPIPINPFLHLYALIKKHATDLLHKNRQPQAPEGHLSTQDIGLLESHLLSGMTTQLQQLESQLFVLAMVVSLGPFLGLLGTVWGILDTFAALQGGGSVNNQAILSGISLALATTVLGLVDAIPALIGYSWLKQSIRTFSTEMECFGHEMLAALEQRYRQP